jgi:hypothetical protein
LIDDQIDLFSFRLLFVFGPLLVASFLPSLIFGVLLNQWGSNLVWGSVFGLGWCIAAFATGGLVHNGVAATIGLIWGWVVLILLWFFATWLWRWLSPSRRRTAVVLLLVSFLVNVPARAFISLDEAGIHLPDYGLHLAGSY